MVQVEGENEGLWTCSLVCRNSMQRVPNGTVSRLAMVKSHPFPISNTQAFVPSDISRYPLATPRFAMHQCTCRKGCMEKCNGVWWYLTGGVRVTPPPVPWSQIHARRHCITKIRDRFMRGRAPNHTGVGGPAQKTEKKKKYAW